MLYLFADDACDILNLYWKKPPAIDARRIISSIATHIKNIRDAYHEEYDIPAGLTRVATFQIPAGIQEDLLEIDPKYETLSFYGTSYNGLYDILPTPAMDPIDLTPANPRATYVTPITRDKTIGVPISTYTVPMTSLSQPDVHLSTTHPPEPILRTFIPSTHFDEDTYNNIHVGLNHFLRIYWSVIDDKESIMDIDQDHFGEHNFGVIYPTYGSLHYIYTTYQYERTFTYQQALFTDSSKIHAILDFATIDDLDRFETDCWNL